MKGDTVTIENSFILLKSGWDKVSKILRKYIPDVTYIWVIEPHKSGYPHLHIVVFDTISKPLQKKIQRLWAEKYEAGSINHGVDFAIRKPEERIDSIRNYLMKYIAKGFISTGTKFTENYWSKEELVFNAIIWKNGFRTFQSSRKLQKVMGLKIEKDDSIWWYTGESVYENESLQEKERYIIWEKYIIPGWLPFRENRLN